MIELDRALKYYRVNGKTKVVLDRVSMRFAEGYSYGILGINGAGKSTLMRVVAGTELPNSGRIRRTSRVSWPLGFAGGLHPALTGRENVAFVARVYRQDVRKVIDYVEDFAEIGSYIDAPVSTYSSGMIQRVAFGLSMAIDFDCYLVDEVMAVGDARFRKRCAEEFEKRRSHSDIILVSHDIQTLQSYCSRAAVLAYGRLHMFNTVEHAVELYKKLNQ